jgi:hypothetical protein
MTLDQARAIALDPMAHPRAHLAIALDVQRRELDRVEAHGDEQRRQRMLAG